MARSVTHLLPRARPIRLDEDLVSIPDIASRVGVSREAVRNWANGLRHSNFPLPRGIVGDGIKVWGWSEVSRWLHNNLHLGDSEAFPNAYDIAFVNAHFSEKAWLPPTAHTLSGTWLVTKRTHTAPTTFVKTHVPELWTEVHPASEKGRVFPGLDHIAA